MKYLFLLLLLVSYFPLGHSGNSFPSGSGVPAEGASGINLVLPSGLPISVGQGAASQWNNSCQMVPCICFDGSGGATVEVLFEQGASGLLDENGSEILAFFDTTVKSITLYTNNASGHTFTNEELTSILTHELGHALGLGDVGDSGCLMGPMRPRPLGGYDSKTVRTTDCYDARNVWRSLLDPGVGTDCTNQLKAAGDCNSPLVIDVNRNGFDFSGPEGGVWFDLYGIDEPVHIQWLRPDTDDAFLVLDLNENGVVDSGAELFGQGSMMWLEGRKAHHGFEALAQYDLESLEGNHDGVISLHDGVWQNLYIWNDRNADGLSTAQELTHLSEADLGRFLLSPKVRRQTDQYGNKLKYWEKAFTGSHPPKPYWVVDVFFKSID